MVKINAVASSFRRLRKRESAMSSGQRFARVSKLLCEWDRVRRYHLEERETRRMVCSACGHEQETSKGAVCELCFAQMIHFPRD